MLIYIHTIYEQTLLECWLCIECAYCYTGGDRLDAYREESARVELEINADKSHVYPLISTVPVLVGMYARTYVCMYVRMFVM